MFSEIRQAILPLALRNLKRRGDLERAGLLIESLAKHWRDSVPLQLLIVSPARDVHLLRTELPRFQNIDVSVRSEGDFFPAFSRFYMMTGWYRQQMVKLHVPAVLGFGGFLTLDSDVCCVGDFDATTFVEDRRALSRWEPKRYHDWWRAASDVVGIQYDAKAHGLSVTPNILHGDLAAQTLEHFRRKGNDPLTTLSLQVLRKLGSIPWTEYSLYTSVAEHMGNLLDYHVHWDPCYFSDLQLFSEHTCVWGADDFERLVKLPAGTDPGGKFIIVQSHARIPLERVRDYCLSFAG
ncbi:hypothetical protein SAMN02745126_00236 [Enhydrobacter aerosaccus]|uniref:Glycosyltransferase sugar-binding region containing DXD motif-containing protein n=1 Tax=Enhydrobacter aerosaccus TaxID=225324 RepID=A0A1T4JNM4_9HYPH|nr:DUF6492 family protein [Enhydrobacter aerosaccus]SJZ31677.1 hypothetical protein SAMN02745126_00236 [Enhydrobacter aerosaccus]